jgi:hypothetical protein
MRENRTCSLGGGRRLARKRASSDPTMVKSAVRMRLTTSSEPQVLLEDLNRVISELIAAEMFVTLALVSLGKSNDLHFATAGHLPILHFRSATGSVCELSTPIHSSESSKSRSSRVLMWNSQAVISRFS